VVTISGGGGEVLLNPGICESVSLRMSQTGNRSGNTPAMMGETRSRNSARINGTLADDMAGNFES